jgi:predicted double-glycine peptidase
MRGKIVRTDFPNDKREILNDQFSIQTQRFGCGAAALCLGLSGDGGTLSIRSPSKCGNENRKM